MPIIFPNYPMRIEELERKERIMSVQLDALVAALTNLETMVQAVLDDRAALKAQLAAAVAVPDETGAVGDAAARVQAMVDKLGQ